MNRQQRRSAESQHKHKAVIHINGKAYTPEEASVLAIQQCGLGNTQTAIDIYDIIIAHTPTHAEAHNNRGILLQSLGRYDEALTSHDKAIALQPEYAEAHNSRGAALQAMHRIEEALASYDRAIALKPDYADAHYNRGPLLYILNRLEEALASYDKAIALNTSNAEAYNNRGITLHEMHRYDEALASYDRTIALKHDHAAAHSNRSVTLRKMKRYDEALASCEYAIALKPDYAIAHNNCGITLQKMKRYDEALISCEKAIALRPDYAAAYQSRGLILVNKGNMQEAEAMFRKALALNPQFLDPLFNLAGIHKYDSVDHADVQYMHALLGNPAMSPRDRDYLYFSLGKIHDDCGRYDEAFAYYRQGNAIRNATASYSAEGTTAFADSLMEVFTKEFLSQAFVGASDSAVPVFIVGMPRSGTTLMASILSNHRAIATAGELPTMNECALRLPEYVGNGVLYPQAAQHITPAVATRMIEDYEKRLRRDAGQEVPHVIDKHPLNFRHLGLITMLFPKARIIHCMRQPLDTGLSNYFQRFALDYSYAFDLRNIGHFYGEYARLMEHWRKVLPTPMIEVAYEDMILNTEATARKALDALGLEWDERCLSPHTNPNPIETASQWQVRQPIYNQSVERWRHYGKHLAPLKEALQYK